RDLTGPHGVANEGDVTQVHGLEQAAQVVGERVVVITTGRLAGLAEAASFVGDDPIAALEKDGHLLVPRTTTEWIAVDEDDRSARAVVFVVQVDRSRVLLTNRDRGHRVLRSAEAENKIGLFPSARVVPYNVHPRRTSSHPPVASHHA